MVLCYFVNRVRSWLRTVRHKLITVMMIFGFDADQFLDSLQEWSLRRGTLFIGCHRLVLDLFLLECLMWYLLLGLSVKIVILKDKPVWIIWFHVRICTTIIMKCSRHVFRGLLMILLLHKALEVKLILYLELVLPHDWNRLLKDEIFICHINTKAIHFLRRHMHNILVLL